MPKVVLPPMSVRCLKTNLSPEDQAQLERCRVAKQAYMAALERGERPPMWTVPANGASPTPANSPDGSPQTPGSEPGQPRNSQT